MDTKSLIIFIGVIVVDVVLVLEIIFIIIRKGVMNKLIEAAFEKNNDKFDKLSNSFIAKIISKFDKELIKYNVADVMKDRILLEASIKRIEAMQLNKAQKKKIYPRIFYHYIDANKLLEAKQYYEKIKEYDVYKNKKDIERTYDAYILKGHKYLDETLKDLSKASKQEKPALEKLIAKMYENKNINAEAKKYYRLAERDQLELQRKNNY